MNKRNTLLLFLLIVIMLLLSCQAYNPPEYGGPDGKAWYQTHVHIHEGHEYLIIYHHAGLAVCHTGSCNCKK